MRNCIVSHVLDNPVFNALISGDARLGSGNERVKLFDPEVSPFIGIKDDIPKGLEEIHSIIAPGRRILLATPEIVEISRQWKLLNFIKGLQFILPGPGIVDLPGFDPVLLKDEHVSEMIELTALTKPGPFDVRTIDFGHYYGIFENGRLASMAGQRLHVFDYTEISAVCTHPGFLGRGHAARLLQFQVNLIAAENKIPFLHVRADNDRAIRLYERMGMVVRSNMNFYFLRKPG